ncbi:MAG: ankyrin repeat domain-containing protein [Treponema sp.]|nr:ankyrin repeat domain-containing protein [Treponema sp.]
MSFSHYKRSFFILLFVFTIFSAYGQSSGGWIITRHKNKKVIEKDQQGPYYSKEQVIAHWIYKEIPEKNKYCIAANSTYMTDSPSAFYRKLYYQIKEEIKNDKEAAILKYNLNDDPELAEKMRIEYEESKNNHARVVGGQVAIPAESKNPESEKEKDQTKTVETAESPKNEEKSSDKQLTLVLTESNKENTSLKQIQNEENIPVEDKTKEDKKEENQKESKEINFSLNLNNKSQVSRYKKEYLQDYIPLETYVPEESNIVITQKIENPDELDSNGRSLLMIASQSGNDWQIKNLLEAKANVNLKDKDGWTALMYAVRYQESADIVRTLLKAGADVRANNNFEYSALILAACYNNNPEILNLLLNNYSISEKEVLKAFTLMLSSSQITEYTELAKVNLFIQKSIPLNAFYAGKTPLMYAAQYGKSTKVLRLLLENEAITSLRSTEGKTAFDYASENKNLEHDEIYWQLNKK